jgi:hypothetical protein
MNSKIEIKSVILGLGVGVLVMLGVAATSSSPSFGRYQLVAVGSHGLIIDTDTGRVWEASFPDNVNRTDPHFFQPKTGDKN